MLDRKFYGLGVHMFSPHTNVHANVVMSRYWTVLSHGYNLTYT